MITENDIKESRHVLVGSTYLLATKNCLYGLKWEPTIYVEVECVCPYCGSDLAIARDGYENGPGGWSYEKYGCGVKTATRIGPKRTESGHSNERCHYYNLLVAISQQTDECKCMVQDAAASCGDII